MNCLHSKCLWLLSQATYYFNAYYILQIFYSCLSLCKTLVYSSLCVWIHVQCRALYGIHWCQLSLWRLWTVETTYKLRLYEHILLNFVLALLLVTGEERQEMDTITGSCKVYDFICCEPKWLKGSTGFQLNKINSAMAQTKIFSKPKKFGKIVKWKLSFMLCPPSKWKVSLCLSWTR